ncbi:hypothetical protein NMY22_g3762 [Coprinellus aureogranulatus]|nr:hypothetical protein NMY22_g3762 [Coprinellus aureogranulatus]
MTTISGRGNLSDIMGMMSAMGAKPDPRNMRMPYGGRPKYVKLASEDSGLFLPPIFFEGAWVLEGVWVEVWADLEWLWVVWGWCLVVDPDEHRPKPGVFGEIHAWGLYPYDEHPSTVDPEHWPVEDDNTPAYNTRSQGLSSVTRGLVVTRTRIPRKRDGSLPYQPYISAVLVSPPCQWVFPGSRGYCKPGTASQLSPLILLPYSLRAHSIPAVDGVLAMMRTMYSQSFYFSRTAVTPERQFVGALMNKKKKQLEQLDLGGLDKQDVVLKIALRQVTDKKGEPLIWRRFRVSAGTKLSSFQDKAIAPIMGWVRNMHCYTFTDFRDGSLFGPEKSDAIDKMHIAQVGYDYLPDGKYSLAHLFSKEGDKIGYLYDFGDKWYHLITVERILPLTDSHGSIEILDGNGACPGENMKGSHNYKDFMKDYFKGSAAERLKKKREILQAPNYTFTGTRPSIPPSTFDPTAFDITAARERVSSALSSANSVPSGSKKFVTPFAPDYKPGNSMFYKGKNKKGVETTVTKDPESWGQWEEAQSTVKDSRKRALCAACGKPGGEALKTCGGCRQVLYCSPEHQMASVDERGVARETRSGVPTRRWESFKEVKRVLTPVRNALIISISMVKIVSRSACRFLHPGARVPTRAGEIKVEERTLINAQSTTRDARPIHLDLPLRSNFAHHSHPMPRTSLFARLVAIAGAVATFYDGDADCDPARRAKSCTWMYPNRCCTDVRGYPPVWTLYNSASMYGIEDLPDGDAGWGIAGANCGDTQAGPTLHRNGCLNRGGGKNVGGAYWDFCRDRPQVCANRLVGTRLTSRSNAALDDDQPEPHCEESVTPDVVFIREVAGEAGRPFSDSVAQKAFGDADVVDWETLTVKEGKLDVFHELVGVYGDGLSGQQVKAMKVLAEEDRKRGQLSKVMARYLVDEPPVGAR